MSFSTPGRRPSRDYATEIAELSEAREKLRAEGCSAIALVGRSYGGRICVFLAAQTETDAVALLGHPIAPPNRPRPRDEQALEALRCATLVVQGDRDELGPLPVLERIAGRNSKIEIRRIIGAKHEFGSRQPEAIAAVAQWLDKVL